jgi:hypothetical protein
LIIWVIIGHHVLKLVVEYIKLTVNSLSKRFYIEMVAYIMFSNRRIESFIGHKHEIVPQTYVLLISGANCKKEWAWVQSRFDPFECLILAEDTRISSTCPKLQKIIRCDNTATSIVFGKLHKSLLLILYWTYGYVIVNAGIKTELFVVIFVHYNNYILLFVWLRLKLRFLGPEWLRIYLNQRAFFALRKTSWALNHLNVKYISYYIPPHWLVSQVDYF